MIRHDAFPNAWIDKKSRDAGALAFRELVLWLNAPCNAHHDIYGRKGYYTRWLCSDCKRTLLDTVKL